VTTTLPGRGAGAGTVGNDPVEAPGDRDALPLREPVRVPLPRRLRRFGPAAEEPYRRRTSDAVRVAVTVVALALLQERVGHVSAAQRDLFDAFNSLSDGTRPAARLLYDLGGLWAAALVVAAAVLARRWRLGRDLLVAGLVAWLLARGIALAVGGDLRHHIKAVVRAHVVPGFPSTHLALVTAVVLTAAPYVTRVTRWVGGVLVASIVPCALYLGVALPVDLTGGLVLGWGVAALVHYAFRSPAGRPTAAQVATALHDLGVQARGVHLAPEQPAGATLMLGRDAAGPLRIAVLGRDETDARLLSSLWRTLAYRDPGPSRAVGRRRRVERWAYLLLLARDRGVRTPELVAAGVGGPGVALLCTRVIGGTVLAEADDATVDDALLGRVWTQAVRLRAARVAHGALDTGHIVLSPDGPYVVGFGSAGAGTQAQLDVDAAQLLISTALHVGERRAIAAARALSAPALARLLPLLQPAVLPRSARQRSERGRRSLTEAVDALRTAVSREVGIPDPHLQQLARVRPSSLLLAAATLLGVVALLGQVGDPEALAHALRHADGWLLLLGAVLSLSQVLGYVLSLLGSVPQRLPLWPSTQLQLAGPFSNLGLPFGSQALQVRFLQRQGVELATAVAATSVVTVGLGTLAQVGLFAAAAALSPRRLSALHLPTGELVATLLAGAAVLVVVSAVILVAPPLRRRYYPPIARSFGTLGHSLRSPRQIALVVGGTVLSSLSYSACLAACLSALHESLPVATLVAVNVGVTTLAQLVPIPGGSTAVSSVGLAGVLAALGEPTATAVAVSLLYQLLSTYLPAVPGWFALRSLLRKRDL